MGVLALMSRERRRGESWEENVEVEELKEVGGNEEVRRGREYYAEVRQERGGSPKLGEVGVWCILRTRKDAVYNEHQL